MDFEHLELPHDSALSALHSWKPPAGAWAAKRDAKPSFGKSFPDARGGHQAADALSCPFFDNFSRTGKKCTQRHIISTVYQQLSARTTQKALGDVETAKRSTKLHCPWEKLQLRPLPRKERVFCLVHGLLEEKLSRCAWVDVKGARVLDAKVVVDPYVRNGS